MLYNCAFLLPKSCRYAFIPLALTSRVEAAGYERRSPRLRQDAVDFTHLCAAVIAARTELECEVPNIFGESGLPILLSQFAAAFGFERVVHIFCDVLLRDVVKLTEHLVNARVDLLLGVGEDDEVEKQAVLRRKVVNQRFELINVVVA